MRDLLPRNCTLADDTGGGDWGQGFPGERCPAATALCVPMTWALSPDGDNAQNSPTENLRNFASLDGRHLAWTAEYLIHGVFPPAKVTLTLSGQGWVRVAAAAAGEDLLLHPADA
jgi:hypothetical protein